MMDLTLAPDSDVLAAKTGDRVAFGRLVARYGRVVTSISLSTVRNVATSEEVAQDVFLAAWRDLGTLRNPASFLPWLRQLTRHRALDAVRRGRRPDGRAAFDESTLAAVVDPRPGAEDALLHDERARTLSAALDALSPDSREVVTLYYREGQSVAQVARLLGLREDTVKKRLSRARAALRDELLAGFADAVASSAPGDGFAKQVMVALPVMSPASALVIGKGVLHLLAKWAFVVAGSASALAGLVGGGIPILHSVRRGLKNAVDERERRELRWAGAAAMANLALFSLGIPLLRSELPAQSRLAGSILMIVFSAVHLAIYCVWCPRVKARRRAAEVERDPGAAARHAREERRRKGKAIGAATIILALLAAAWIR